MGPHLPPLLHLPPLSRIRPMVRKPCLYPNCLKSTRRREKHDNLPHYQCLECEAVAPRKLQSQHSHPSFTTQPLTRPPTPSICRNKPEPCWCSRCPIQESKNITRHKKTPHYICETCDSEGGKKVFIGEVIARRHKRFHQGHIVSKIRQGDRTEHTPLTSVNVSPENSAHRLNICLQPRLNDHTTANGAQASVELSRTRSPGRPSLEELAATLRESQRIVCVVGAGISTSAGIPDFRSAQGLFVQLETEHGLAEGSGKEILSASVYEHESTTAALHSFVRRFLYMALGRKQFSFTVLSAKWNVRSARGSMILMGLYLWDRPCLHARGAASRPANMG